MSSITFKIVPPPPALKSVVRCFRVAEHIDDEPLTVNICPNGLPGMVVQAGCVEALTTSKGVLRDVPTLFLYGQGTEPSVMHFASGPYITVQVLLQPDGLRLFGPDASTLTDDFLSADDIKATQLNKTLLETNDEQRMITLLGDFLLSRLAYPAADSDELVEVALQHIDQQIESISVAELITMFDISERQFEKRFKRAVGIAPQLYIRIRRFNQAMQLMDSGKYERLSDIAFALDFHDQSHFIRDIKIFSGKTPKGITQKVDEFYHDQVGTSFI